MLAKDSAAKMTPMLRKISTVVSGIDVLTQTSACPTRARVQLHWELNEEPELKLSLGVRMSEDVAVVNCKGRIVYRKEVAALSYAVADLLLQARQVVLELSGVESMDGAGVGELLAILARAQESGCVFTLAAPSKPVRALLELTRVATAFEIYSSVDEALLAAHAPAV
jgi:anti-anti-sigma factor